MNIRKIFILLVILIILFGGFYFFSKKQNQKSLQETGLTTSQLKENRDFVKNLGIEEYTPLEALFRAKIKVPDLDQEVTLFKGQAEFKSEDSFVSGFIALGEPILFKNYISKKEKVSKENIIAPFAVSAGGSGVFNYLAIFEYAHPYTWADL